MQGLFWRGSQLFWRGRNVKSTREQRQIGPGPRQIATQTQNRCVPIRSTYSAAGSLLAHDESSRTMGRRRHDHRRMAEQLLAGIRRACSSYRVRLRVCGQPARRARLPIERRHDPVGAARRFASARPGALERTGQHRQAPRCWCRGRHRAHGEQHVGCEGRGALVPLSAGGRPQLWAHDRRHAP